MPILPRLSTMMTMKPRFFSTCMNLRQAVQVEQSGVIKSLTIDRPVQRNAFNTEVWQSLAKAVREGDADDSTNIITITGKGEQYTAGNDLAEGMSAPSMEHYAKCCASNAENFIAALIDCRKPIVALVNGGAVGIGCTMLGLCDLVFASNKAYFLTPFANLGIVAEGCSSYTFPRIMGFAKASSLLLANERFDAQQAYTCGLVTEIIPHDVFVDETKKRVQKISQFPIKALMHSKELLRGNERQTLHAVNKKECQGVEHFLQSPECQASIQKFFATRKKKAE